MVEIVRHLKKILGAVTTLQQTTYNHHTRHQKGGGDDLESLLRLAELAEKSHSSLTGVTSSQHHTKTSKLSEITIDVDKNWAGKNITNFGTRGYNLSNQLIAGISFNLGLATVGTKLAQALIPGTFSISKVILWGDNAPTGADLIVDINKNGSTIFTTQANRPKIAAGAHSGESGTPNIISINKGDRLSVDTDQVGSTTPGGDDLLVTIIC